MVAYRFGPTASHNFYPSILLVTALLVVNPLKVGAERLPFRNYGLSDGLAHNRVNVIHQDRKGYLWLGTFEGLSRFDGYQFVNYGTAEGLAHPTINTITEDRDGRLWVGTNRGGASRRAE